MLRVLVTSRVAAMTRTYRSHRPLWTGSLHPTALYSNKAMMDRQPCLLPTASARKMIQRRNYIFLPSSLSDASKLMKALFDNNHQSNKRIMVKLRHRWQDTLFSFREQMKLLKTIQSEQRTLARQRAHAARNSLKKRSGRYSLFVENMRGHVGRISSVALSKGKTNLFSHYNAKKRVYARRKLARQLARKMSGNRTLLERWKSNYALGKNAWGGWMSGVSSNITTGTANIDRNTSNMTWKGITLTEPTQQSWFDKEGYPLTSRDPETGRFVNPWLSESTNGEHGLKKFFKWKLGGPWCRFLHAIGLSSDLCDQIDELKRKSQGTSSNPLKSEIIKVISDVKSPQASTPQTSTYQSCASSATPGLRIGEQFYHTSATDGKALQENINLTWIGHSSTLVKFPGNFTILTDPHFSNYAGPVRRNAPPAFGVADLPEVVDCVLISHDHMDHLDYWSILELIESNKVKYWIVPLGIKAWLMDQAGVSPEDIVELEWWEGVRISKTPQTNDLNGVEHGGVWPEVEGLARAFDKVSGQRGDEKLQSYGLHNKHELVVTCAPAQHWCSRTPFDRNRRLWCSYAVHATPVISQPASQTHSFYFAGDTGLPPEFPLHHQIGDRLGPFDLSAIPIGAYEPEWFMRESHCNPAEAVKIHQAVRSRRSVAIHFDAFDLADEPREEPPRRLLDEVGMANTEILNMAAEAVAVVDEVCIAEGLEEKEGQSTQDEAIEEGAILLSPVVEHEVVAESNKRLIEMLPPLVDFAVIKQGQSIESLPR